MVVKFKCHEQLPAGSVDVFCIDSSLRVTVWGSKEMSNDRGPGYHKFSDNWHDYILTTPTVDRDDILLVLSEVLGLGLDSIELVSN